MQITIRQLKQLIRETVQHQAEPTVKYVRPNEFRDIGSSVMIMLKNGHDVISNNIRIYGDGTVVDYNIGARTAGGQNPSYNRADVDYIDNWRRDGKYIRWIVDGRRAPKQNIAR